jgi:NAD(P)-dependent dehydrogenase (short-subunit alcohol dehydrogenase family)/pimeloyl-ACP methyl ester carboxylesterase
MLESRRVTATDGVRLAVYEQGDPARPTIVCVHGYPDNASVWDGLAALLAERFRVVSYDVRGAGASDAPKGRSSYRLDQLASDLRAVIDADSPDEPVHLLAHDWGSIQSWHAITGDELDLRVASYTSISGPSLDHAGAWVRTNLRPVPGRFGKALWQLAHSCYITFFQLPVLPELACRAGLLNRAIALSERSGYAGRASTADQINGLNLYRANMLPRLGRPDRGRRTNVPVQVIAPTRDPFVSQALQLEAPKPYAAELYLRSVEGTHWVIRNRPEVIARAATELIDQVENGEPSIALARARTKAQRGGTLVGDLVLITGAGSGIGRETAYAFAQRGADLILADINDVAAKETAAIAGKYGVKAYAYRLDVADIDAWEEFAQQIKEEHGVPDVLVNNAGIGMAGPFLSTSRSDWDRIIDINLRSVIHGSRIVAAQMVERGEGGRIVNIASAAAYSPSRTYPAYATTKAAVLMLSECLTAELGREGITVTAICPGFINTNISATTTHVGLDREHEAAKQAKAVRSYTRRNFSPQRAAKEIVAGVAKDKPIVYITAEALGFLALDRFLPPVQRLIAKYDLTEL